MRYWEQHLWAGGYFCPTDTDSTTTLGMERKLALAALRGRDKGPVPMFRPPFNPE